VNRLLEIGVSKRSLVTWLECFPDAEVVGLDTEPNGPTNTDDIAGIENDRLTFVLGDQTDVDLLESLGAFDAIFDDGGHHSRQQIASFMTLFPRMNSGGWYFIEDIHCSYMAGYQDDGLTTMDFIQFLLDDMHSRYMTPPGTQEWPISEVRFVDSVAAFRRS
jgi:hypothetical protein